MASPPAYTACAHIEQLAPSLKAPTPSQQVHREECTLCFDGQDGPDGVLVCMQCFNGGCVGENRKHAFLHYEKRAHPLALVIKRTRRAPKQRDESEPPLKKLAITAPSDDDTYEYTTSMRCFKCSPLGEAVHSDHPNVLATTKGIMTALSSAQQSEVKAWEEEIIPCEHTLTIDQVPLVAPGHLPTQCTECDLKDNLWLCLTCGLANCGRQQWGGLGGNGHALQHFQDTGHPVGVKLGTITPEGAADIYCYSCDDAKVDPGLAAHLKTFGISVLEQSKTEKSMTELQLEQNLKYDFSMTGEDGKELRPVFGEGLTGLKNLGNSCYMASVMQALFSTPSFRERYFSDEAQAHVQTCDRPFPADCLECQMLKLADGLVSGRYSVPAKAPPPATSDFEVPEAPKFQEGIRPTQFKALIGKGHAEFSTMQQQDAEEFLQYLVERLRQEAKHLGRAENIEATNALRFGLEQRLECTECHRVGYKVEAVDLASLPVDAVETGVDEDGKKLYKEITLESCIQSFAAPEQLDDYACSNCNKRVKAVKTTTFESFPQLLVLQMRKFQLVNWLPTKIDVPIMVPDSLALDAFHGTGRQPGEQELDVAATPAQYEFNAAALAQLEDMGFPTVRCQKALLATGNSDAEAAMSWLFENMDRPDIDAPLVFAGHVPEPDAEQLKLFSEMGITAGQARKALRATGGNDTAAAIEWIFNHPDDNGEDAEPPARPGVSAGGTPPPARYRLKTFISHKGPSVHSGHYVATIRHPQAGLPGGVEKEDDWVLFNDEKVATAADRGGDELRSLAYLYVYERV